MTFRKNLNVILHTYGITNKRRRDEFLDTFATAIQDNIADQICGYARQLTMDAVCIALNDEFGFGADRLKRLEKLVDSILDEIDATSVDETVDNIRNNNREESGRTDVPILKARLDSRLREIFKDIDEFDVRYSKAQDKERAHGWDRVKEILGDCGLRT